MAPLDGDLKPLRRFVRAHLLARATFRALAVVQEVAQDEFVDADADAKLVEGLTERTDDSPSKATPPARPPPPATNTAAPPATTDTAQPNADGGDSGGGFMGTLTAIVNEVRKPGEPAPIPADETFNAKTLASNITRFADALAPFGDLVDEIERIQWWEDPKTTGAYCVFYVLCALYNWILPGACMLGMFLFGRPWLIEKGYLTEPAQKATPTPQNTAPEQPMSTWDNIFKSISEKVIKVSAGGGKVQAKIGLFAERLEKIVHLINWTVPANSMRIERYLLIGFVVTVIVPFDILVILMKLNFGLKFFITGYVYHNHPSLRQYDSTYQFWLGLPFHANAPAAVQAPGHAGTVQGQAAPTTGNTSSSTTPTPGTIAAGQPYTVAAATGTASADSANAGKKDQHEGIGNIGIHLAEIQGSWHAVSVNKSSVLSSKSGQSPLCHRDLDHAPICFVWC